MDLEAYAFFFFHLHGTLLKDKQMILAEKSKGMWKLKSIQVSVLMIGFYTPDGQPQEPKVYCPLTSSQSVQTLKICH